MRCRLVRFGVGSLLFAVALVAANFAVFRRFSPDLFEFDDLPTPVLEAEVGAIPALDALLIGVWLAASRCLRARRQVDASPPRPACPGIAFFSGQFLLIGWLATSFHWPWFLAAREAIVAAMIDIANAWGMPSGSHGGLAAWVACQILLLGVLISGPMLLLAGIGRVTLRRSARRLTRTRFRTMVALIAIGFAEADLAICFLPRPIQGDEEFEVKLEFRVVEAGSGRPIRAALARLTDPFANWRAPEPAWVHADSAGLVRVGDAFRITGETNAFQFFGTFSPWGRRLEVAAPGYRTLRVSLSDVLGLAVDPSRPVRRGVALAAGPDAPETCRDLAGTYLAHMPVTNYSLKIEADSRFAWSECGLSDNTPAEYGHLNRSGATIEFVPAPHPGREPAAGIFPPYCVIRRGNAVVLTPMNSDGFKGWCRTILAGPRPVLNRILPWSFFRDLNRRNPASGIPRIPREAWVRMLASVPVVTNPADAWRLVIDRVAAWGRDEP